MFNQNPFLQQMQEQMRQELERARKENEKALCRLFAGKIKANFLLSIKSKVIETIGNDMPKYFDFNADLAKMAMGVDDMMTMDYEICKIIVGIHRSNMIFVDDNTRRVKETNDDYCSQLVENVITHIKLRPFASAFFRKMPIINGESFIYFPLPYDLFAISIQMNYLLSANEAINKLDTRLRIYFVQIANKCAAALSMLEDNFLDNAYPICRGIIELYLKLIVVIYYPNIKDKFFKFADFEIRQTCCEQEYPEEFNVLFDNRISKFVKTKVSYLHFGWVDDVPDYHKIVKTNPYSMDGLFAFITFIANDKDNPLFTHLEMLYKMCHGYTHGSVSGSKYPLLHYFEISSMLYYTIEHSYRLLCDILEIPTNIADIDIIKKTDRDYGVMTEQYNKRSTKNFEKYYAKNS